MGLRHGLSGRLPESEPAPKDAEQSASLSLGHVHGGGREVLLG